MTTEAPALHLDRPELELLLRYLPGVIAARGENEVLRSVRHELLHALELLAPAPAGAK